MPTCRICNKKLERITHMHLKTHNTTSQEYRKMYPDAEIVEKIDSSKDLNIFENQFEKFEEQCVEEEVAVEELSEDIGFSFKDDESVSQLRNPKHDEKDPFEKEQDSSKRKILNYLRNEGFNIKNNYMIRSFNPNKTVKFEIITDMADPSSKIDFEFPNSFWHNCQVNYAPHIRVQMLRSLGWRVIEIKDRMPKPEHVSKVIKK